MQTVTQKILNLSREFFVNRMARTTGGCYPNMSCRHRSLPWLSLRSINLLQEQRRNDRSLWWWSRKNGEPWLWEKRITFPVRFTVYNGHAKSLAICFTKDGSSRRFFWLGWLIGGSRVLLKVFLPRKRKTRDGLLFLKSILTNDNTLHTKQNAFNAAFKKQQFKNLRSSSCDNDDFDFHEQQHCSSQPHQWRKQLFFVCTYEIRRGVRTDATWRRSSSVDSRRQGRKPRSRHGPLRFAIPRGHGINFGRSCGRFDCPKRSRRVPRLRQKTTTSLSSPELQRFERIDDRTGASVAHRGRRKPMWGWTIRDESNDDKNQNDRSKWLEEPHGRIFTGRVGSNSRGKHRRWPRHEKGESVSNPWHKPQTKEEYKREHQSRRLERCSHGLGDPAVCPKRKDQIQILDWFWGLLRLRGERFVGICWDCKSCVQKENDFFVLLQHILSNVHDGLERVSCGR